MNAGQIITMLYEATIYGGIAFCVILLLEEACERIAAWWRARA